MSNNFLVRQFLKVSGSFFVGASIAIGTLCPIVLNSSRALADSTELGIPADAANELQTLANQGINPKTIAFTPNGGWVILNGSNGYNSSNLPQDALTELTTLHNQKSTINTIAFAPNGAWVIIFDSYGFSQSSNFPQDALNELTTLNKQKSTINTIAFAPNGAWVIIFDGNGYSTSANFPQDALNELARLNKNQYIINSFAFTPNGGWVSLYNNNSNTTHGYNHDGSVPQSALDAIAKENSSSTADYILTNIAFTPSNGWALLYQVDEAATYIDAGAAAAASANFVP